MSDPTDSLPRRLHKWLWYHHPAWEKDRRDELEQRLVHRDHQMRFVGFLVKGLCIASAVGVFFFCGPAIHTSRSQAEAADVGRDATDRSLHEAG